MSFITSRLPGLLPSSYSSKNPGGVNVKDLWKSKSFRRQEIKVLTSAQVKELVGYAAKDIKSKKEVLSFVQSLSAALPIEKIEQSIRMDIPQYVDVADFAKQMQREAGCYLQKYQGVKNPSIVETLQSVFRSIVVCLEDFLRSFGMIDFFHPLPYTKFSDKKSQQVMMLSTLFSSLTSTLIPILGPAAGGAWAGGVFLSLLVLSATHAKWRPMPTYLPFLQNWSEKFRENTLNASFGRKEVLDEIADSLAPAGKNYGRVMLVGKSGMGKTELIKSLTAAIERGEYPQLKGKQVYYVNTGDLFLPADWLPEGQGILTFFSKEMGHHRNNVVIVLDQIHVAYQAGRSLPVAEQFKAMLDLPMDLFPHVIAITTKEDYYRDIHPRQAGLIDRFDCVVLEETKEAESFYILSETLLKEAPETLLEEGALTYLLEKVKETFVEDAAGPSRALNILSKCIQRASSLQKTDLEGRVQNLRRTLERESVKRILNPGEEKTSLLEMEKELLNLEAQLKQEKEKALELFALRKVLLDLKKTSYEMVTQVNKGTGEKVKKSFLLLVHFFAPALESEILRMADLLGVKVRIDKALIDDVLQDELENQRKTNPPKSKKNESSESASILNLSVGFYQF